jgi:hypothetical protein
MKNVIGTPARGDSFFPRKREVEKIIDKLNDGNNLQIAAPRRIGKTSILFHLKDAKIGGYIYVYVDTEAIDNEQEFYKKLLKELMKVDEIKNSKKMKKLFEEGNKFLKKIKSIKVMGQGIDFHEDQKDTDYLHDIINLLSGIEFDDDKQLVIMMDEFPQTIQNIVDANGGDVIGAQKFLQSNRELRINPEINQKIRFIITGSIGLNHTVSSIESSAFVNDLNSVEVGAMIAEEAKELLNDLLEAKRLSIEENVAEYLLGKIEWLIPFHIQLAVQEIITQASQSREITHTTIDKAFDAIIQARNNNHFEHYYSRLKRHFKNADFAYADELLQIIAENGTIEKARVFDLSAKHGVQEKWRNIIEILMYDGYINNVENKNIYRFNSPILRMWWQRFICK